MVRADAGHPHSVLGLPSLGAWLSRTDLLFTAILTAFDLNVPQSNEFLYLLRRQLLTIITCQVLGIQREPA